MMRLRYADIQNSRTPDRVGVCPTNSRLMQWANSFQSRALAYGRWYGTTQLAQFCITPASCGGTCIVLPREVALIEAANLNGVPVNVQNMWGQFVRPHLPMDGAQNCGSGSGTPCNGFRPFSCGCGCGCRSVPQMEDAGLVPTFAVTAAGDQIRLYATNAADNGKKVVVQGNNANGVWVRTTIDGVVQDGEQVTLSTLGATTVNTWAVGSPVAVYKEVTSYRVLMFAVDSSANERQLADYQPSETNPTYRKVRFPSFNGNCGCSSNMTLRAIVSLQHVPVTHANDWLLFTNLPAYEDGIYSEKLRENGDIDLADAFFFGTPRPARNGRGVLRSAVGMGAIPLLESELRKQTGDRTSVSVRRDGLNLAGFV